MLRVRMCKKEEEFNVCEVCHVKFQGYVCPNCGKLLRGFVNGR